MNYIIIHRNQKRVVFCANTWILRRECRNLLGRRESVSCRYKQIGSNSFQVEKDNRVLIEAYKQESWNLNAL